MTKVKALLHGAAAITVMLAMAAPAGAQDYSARIARVLRATPLIDGHNDWAEVLREREGEARWTMDLTHAPVRTPVPYNTDVEKLHRGMVGGQFWSVFVSPNLPGEDQVIETLEQIDLVKNIVARYPKDFAMARTAADVRRIHKSGRVASMIGVEGGGQINNSLSVLRTYHELGAGYLTLTHAKTIAWADSATDNPQHDGLTAFGEAVVRELNRLGMLVDLAHVSEGTMLDALRVSKAPVIFSHSSARALVDHTRNVPDEVLKLLPANGGVVMVNYAAPYVSDAFRRWSAEESAEKTRINAPPLSGLFIGEPEKAKAALAQWYRDNPRPVVTIGEVADHIEHIVKVAGIDHVGIGSDYDGVGTMLPKGLEDVSTYPLLLAELMKRGWSDTDIAKLAGNNVLRVMTEAEAVAAKMAGQPAETQLCVPDKSC